MRGRALRFWWMIGLLAALCTPQAVSAAGDDPAGVAFFEQKIRPMLVKECYACHSSRSKTLKGGLRVDTSEGLRKVCKQQRDCKAALRSLRKALKWHGKPGTTTIDNSGRAGSPLLETA